MVLSNLFQITTSQIVQFKESKKIIEFLIPLSEKRMKECSHIPVQIDFFLQKKSFFPFFAVVTNSESFYTLPSLPQEIIHR